jgi:hypothetical protein
MNLRWKTIIYSLCLSASLNIFANTAVFLKNDFSSAIETISQKQTLISATLSDAGIIKMAEQNKIKGQNINIKISGVDHILKFRAPIIGKKIEFGPFDRATAQKIISEINRK